MSRSEQSVLTTPMLSITNFDLPSLHLLHNEIIVTLKNAENHLSDFIDYSSRATLLMDSVDDLSQLSCIFDLISLKGGQILSLAIAEGLQQLYDNKDQMDTALIMDLSEAIMTLDRYIEFVLLTETIEPTLLLTIINKLLAYSEKPAINAESFADFGSSSVIIANPEKNFQSLNALDLDSEVLTNVYRSGLAILLANHDGIISIDDSKKLKAMSSACALIAGLSNSLFWQAATAAVTDIEALLPLSLSQKHTLIYLEQQFNSYLPVMDSRFADLVSFACKRDNEPAQKLREQYAINQLDLPQIEEMKRFLFGPNRAITDLLNDLIQEKISTVKDKVSSYARADSTGITYSHSKSEQTTQIAASIAELSSALALLGLNDTATALKSAADAVKLWHNPSSTDFDYLLLALMKAENAAIAIAKRRTPGAISLSMNNQQISSHQLDTTYIALVKESRATITNAEQIMTQYSVDSRNLNSSNSSISNISISNISISNTDSSLESKLLALHDLPGMIRQVAGALQFLELTAAANMFSQLATYIQQHLDNTSSENSTFNDSTFAYIADVLMAVDYRLESFEQNRPVNKRVLDVGQLSLSRLLAA